jgi:hypothetical protein
LRVPVSDMRFGLRAARRRGRSCHAGLGAAGRCSSARSGQRLPNLAEICATGGVLGATRSGTDGRPRAPRNAFTPKRSFQTPDIGVPIDGRASIQLHRSAQL